jgi:hypothetical protein
MKYVEKNIVKSGQRSINHKIYNNELLFSYNILYCFSTNDESRWILIFKEFSDMKGKQYIYRCYHYRVC